MLYAVYQYPNCYVYIRFAAWMPFIFTINPSRSCANALIFSNIWCHRYFMNEISCWNGKCRRVRTITLPLSLSHAIFVYQQYNVTWALSPAPHTGWLLILLDNFNGNFSRLDLNERVKSKHFYFFCLNKLRIWRKSSYWFFFSHNIRRAYIFKA